MYEESTVYLFQENICGLKGNTDELLSSMSPNSPNNCFSEHNLKKFDLDQINGDGYRLGAAYCRQAVKRGAVCIFVQKNLKHINIDLAKYCKDQDTEVCVLKLESTFFMLLSWQSIEHSLAILTCFVID
jgi:hypothetical protein